jgi:Leucine-rich repeat (LRR) protein
MMEAAASGTAPTMELHMSSFAETDGNFLRSRTSESTINNNDANDANHNMTLQGGESNISNTSTVSRQSSGQSMSTNLFAPRDNKPTTPSLNLMDHSTGIYQEQSKGFVNTVKNLFFARTGTEGANDASPAMPDDFVGDVFQRRPGRASNKTSRVNPVLVMCRSCLGSRKRVMAIMAVLVAMFVFIFASTSITAGRSKRASNPSEKVVRARHSVRFNAIFDHIVSEGVSHSKVFLSTTTPEFHALRWVSYMDPANLDPLDPMTLQRYALAVFYYASFLQFEKIAGDQKSIESALDSDYEGVPNPGWTRKDYWLTEKGICKWYGIKCAEKEVDGTMVTHYDMNDPIRGLNLTSNRMYGTLPPEFKGLDSMEVLDLSHNRMHGSLPSQVGRLYALKQLFLHHNDMTGQLPAELGLVESAEDVRLDYNKFTGTIPSELSRLYSVQSISLDHNELTGTLPDLSNCARLTHLYLNDNDLNGRFPFVIAKLSGLHELELQNNKITGTIPPEVESLRLLANFQVQNNKIHGDIPGHIFLRLTNLKTLYLQENQFKGKPPTQIGALTQLRELKLNDNKLKGDFPAEWGNLSNLEVLHIFDNKVGGSMPTQVGGMRGLREFHAQNNEMNHLPTELGLLTNLETLYLDLNKIRGKVPGEIGQLGKLETLRLHHNLLTGSIPMDICTLKTFKSLQYIEADCNNGVECVCCDKCY